MASSSGITIVDALMDFVEASVHTILYARQIYPSMVFEQRVKYGVNVFFCRDREVVNMPGHELFLLF